MEELDRIPPKAGSHPKTAGTQSRTRSGSENQKVVSDDPDAFSAILSQRLKPGHSLEGLSPEPSVSGPDESSGLPELQGAFRTLETQSTGQDSTDQDRSYFVQKLEGFISDLDTYASWLSDPGKSLKAVQELLQKMREEVQTLAGELNQDARNFPDQDLTGMVDSLGAILETEQIKMDRGDYL